MTVVIGLYRHATGRVALPLFGGGGGEGYQILGTATGFMVYVNTTDPSEIYISHLSVEGV